MNSIGCVAGIVANSPTIRVVKKGTGDPVKLLTVRVAHVGSRMGEPVFFDYIDLVGWARMAEHLADSIKSGDFGVFFYKSANPSVAPHWDSAIAERQSNIIMDFIAGTKVDQLLDDYAVELAKGRQSEPLDD